MQRGYKIRVDFQNSTSNNIISTFYPSGHKCNIIQFFYRLERVYSLVSPQFLQITSHPGSHCVPFARMYTVGTNHGLNADGSFVFAPYPTTRAA